MADTKIKKTTYQTARQKIEQIIDDFPESIYFKHYGNPSKINSALSQKQPVAKNPSFSDQGPLPRNGQIAIYNRSFAKELIQRIVRRAPSIINPGLKKIVKELGIADINDNLDLTDEKLDKFRKKANHLTDFDIFHEELAKKFYDNDLEVIFKKRIIWDHIERINISLTKGPLVLSIVLSQTLIVIREKSSRNRVC